jgi:hypothetical protein
MEMGMIHHVAEEAELWSSLVINLQVFATGVIAAFK